MDYGALKTLLAQEPYASLSDEEAADALNAKTVTVAYSRFVSYRTLMAELPTTDYRTMRATFQTAAESDVLLADADAAMSAEAGGLDFGHATARAMIDTLFAADLAATLKALAEHLVSPAEAAGIGAVQIPDVEIARGSRPSVQQEPAHG